MFSIYRSDTDEHDLRPSHDLELGTRAMKDQSSLSMDEAFLQRNLHFHEFHNANRTCECGLSIVDYWGDADKNVCPVVCDGLCDLLPMFAD
jgi:hypothetical protein